MGKPTPIAFEQRLAIGMGFEQQTARFLTSLGFPIGIYFSAKGQWEFGESAAHVEIKLDQKFKKTGNLFIEIKERRDNSGLSQWRPAGIYDLSEPWFFVIGDPSKIWLLSVRWLILMHRNGKYRLVSSDTCEGFLVPVEVADRIAIKIWSDWSK